MMKWHVDASEVVAVTAMGVWEAVLAGGGRRFIKRKDSDAGETGALASPSSFVFVAQLDRLDCSFFLFSVRDFRGSPDERGGRRRRSSSGLLCCGEGAREATSEVATTGREEPQAAASEVAAASGEELGGEAAQRPAGRSSVGRQLGVEELGSLLDLSGRALEELRSSLYNEMHGSEGAKRQQQRFCGPSVALTFNFAVAVGIIMANKMVMGSVGFKFPIALSLIHYAVAFVLMATLKTLSLLPVAPPSKSTPFSSIFALGAVMSFSTGLANVSLKHNSVGFYQMAKIAVTPTIAVAEFMLLQKKLSSRKVVFCNKMRPASLFGFLLQWSGALALGATSALSHVVLGQFKIIVIVLSGYLIFGSDPGITSVCGAVVALGGMSFYTYLGLMKDSATGNKKPMSRQNSFLGKPKGIVDTENPDSEHEDSV
ncbi:hypothetical protein PR202_ga02570 [Eleusine coracana subsp. coracana]|uniref:Sugar phosphate transporter domain-containing protein n=1 Tax=Eleusine coracana subsp. coracana TaxID=191504 RepID=A0AAV5BJU0_ELECO|nr:hypothetical protein PR202_ga02570 [Eleusine coracana subsp. coracana]